MFFLSWKTDFKLSRHLIDTSSTPSYLSSFQNFSYRNLNKSSKARWIDLESSWTHDSFSITGGSIELLFYVFASFLESFICRSCFPRYLPRQMARHLYLSRITEALYMGLLWSGSHFLDLSQSICSYSPPKHFLLPLNLQPTWFSAFPFFKSFGMCSFSLILHAFHAFKPRFWGFWNFLGYFKIDEFKISCIMKNLDRQVSVKLYEKQNSSSILIPIRVYVFGLSFLTTLDI